ncbi:hypothetical protein [Sporosarcina sp. HYO08]|uniref:hypothetical protein n=1 Tax=Sporosarcina sp. HYO08 TaxID=1759557 RepID=UPI00079C65DF|nr:hypothetical protein [Sporosarcina sp. HYO08]KXH81936.1 hypothetical protein AU377_06665 [Sporosarcina sp. HYO08]
MKINSFSGTVTAINDFGITPTDENGGCYQLFTVDNGSGSIVNFVVEPTTYFVDHTMVRIGDRVTGFYDADVPVPFIYPPQYRTIVMAKYSPNRNVKVDFFNRNLLSSDGQLKLNLSPQTKILLTNGQAFRRYPANRTLVVVYDFTTKSIPAQTSPTSIIVLCH